MSYNYKCFRVAFCCCLLNWSFDSLFISIFLFLYLFFPLFKFILPMKKKCEFSIVFILLFCFSSESTRIFFSVLFKIQNDAVITRNYFPLFVFVCPLRLFFWILLTPHLYIYVYCIYYYYSLASSLFFYLFLCHVSVSV